jgi:hypothetical protein
MNGKENEIHTSQGKKRQGVGDKKGEKFGDFVLLCINCCKFPSTSEAI